MKKNKLEIITISVLIILIVMVSIIGVYSKSKNKMENQVKDYKYDMDIDGSRVISLKVDTNTETTIKDAEGNVIEDATDEDIEKNGYTKEETKINKDEDLTVDNYKISEDIIKGRLDSLNNKITQKYANDTYIESDKIKVQDYEVRLNEENGDITVRMPESYDVDTIVSNLSSVGKMEIIDTDTKEVLLNNDDIKESKVECVPTSQGTVTYVTIEFNDNGKKKLEEISKTYVPVEEATESEDEATEETSSEETTETESVEQTEETTSETTDETATSDEAESTAEEEKEKTITMQLDGTDIMSTSFEEPVTDGILELSVGSVSEDRDTVKGYVQQAQNMSSLLNNKSMPLTYELVDSTYFTSSAEETTNEMLIGIAIVAVLVLVIFVFKYKVLGLIATTAFVGFAALMLLIVRYWNVVISSEGIVALFGILILSFISINKIIKNINKNSKEDVNTKISNAMIDTTLKFIPLFILSIVLAFSSKAPASSYGMVVFWGLLLIELYNYIITKNLLKYGKQE